MTLETAAVLQYFHSCLLVFSLCLITEKNIVIKGNSSKFCFPLNDPTELL